jgi:hypothetical protein
MENGLDPVACSCIDKDVVGRYPWRDESDYRPVKPGRGVKRFVAENYGPITNSNTFVRYYAFRCTKQGQRPPKPHGAIGWDADLGRGDDHPPPYGGVVNYGT